MEDLTSKANVKKLIAGDEQAFSALVTFFAPQIRRFVMRYAQLDEPDSEEIASDVLFKVYKHIKEFDPNRGAKLSTWIFEIAKNTAIDYLRQQASQRKKLSSESTVEYVDVELAEKRGQIDASYYRETIPRLEFEEETEAEDVLLLRQAFDSLSVPDKDILRMKQVLEYEEIAQREKITVNNARVRHKRAKEHLLALYEKEKGNE